MSERRPGLWTRWALQLATRERGTSLALFRVAVGLALMLNMALVIHAGIVDVVWVDVSHGGLLALRPNWLLAAFGGARPGVIWGFVITALVCGALVAVGLGGPIPALVGLQTHLSLYSLMNVASGGFDDLTSNALWILVLGLWGPTATLSLDCRLRRGRWTDDAPVLAFPRYLAVLQLVVLYGTTGLHKLSATWLPSGGYTALYWALQDATFRRLQTEWVAAVFPLTQFATFVAWLFEVTAPLLVLVFYYRATRDRPGRVRALFNRWDLRIPFLVVGVALHLGILVLFEVGPFSVISLSYYFCLWRPEELERLGRRLARRAPISRSNARAER